MNSSRTWTFAFIGLLIAGVAWFWLRRSDDTGITAKSDASVVAKPEAVLSTSSNSRHTVEADAPLANVGVKPVVSSSDDIVMGSTESPQQIKSLNAELRNAEGALIGRSDEAAHSGTPFSVSASVLRYCESISHGGTASCGKHLAIVAQLERENRDSTWAAATEAAIASVVDAQIGFHIRALKCGATVCAVEIESSDMFSGLFFDQISDRLWLEDALVGHERNDRNEMVKVTSITFTREEPSK